MSGVLPALLQCLATGASDTPGAPVRASPPGVPVPEVSGADGGSKFHEETH